MPVGAVGVGEARTAVLSGHQLARPFTLGARGARFAGGMVDEGSEGKKAREMSSFLAPDKSLGRWAGAVVFEASPYLCSCRVGIGCIVVECKVAKSSGQLCMQTWEMGFVECKPWPKVWPFVM